MAKVTIVIEDLKDPSPGRNMDIAINFEPACDTSQPLTDAQYLGFEIIQFVKETATDIELVKEPGDNDERH
jgi:hypothetical protein